MNTAKLVVYACHCLECQKQSASAFALSAPLPAEAFSITGNLSVYGRATDSGSHTNCYFCAACGTRLYHQSQRSPELITLKAGTLDDAAKLTPVGHLWISRAHSWVTFPDDVETFATQPDDLKAWRAALVAGLQDDVRQTQR